MLNGRGHLILSRARSSEDSKSSRSNTGHPPKLPIHLATVCESDLTSLHSHSISLIFKCLTYYIISNLVSISPTNNALVSRIQPTIPRSQLPMLQVGEEDSTERLEARFIGHKSIDFKLKTIASIPTIVSLPSPIPTGIFSPLEKG